MLANSYSCCWSQRRPLRNRPAPQGQAPAVAAGASVTTVATVEAINQETREVSLRKEDGETCADGHRPRSAQPRAGQEG